MSILNSIVHQNTHTATVLFSELHCRTVSIFTLPENDKEKLFDEFILQSIARKAFDISRSKRILSDDQKRLILREVLIEEIRLSIKKQLSNNPIKSDIFEKIFFNGKTNSGKYLPDLFDTIIKSIELKSCWTFYSLLEQTLRRFIFLLSGTMESESALDDIIRATVHHHGDLITDLILSVKT